MPNSSKVLKLKVPPSKSLTQRALVVSSLCVGKSQVVDPLDCDDSRVLISALKEMGIPLRAFSEDSGKKGLAVTGPKEFVVPEKELFLNNAGTAVRFLTPFSLLFSPQTSRAQGAVSSLRIDGVEAMRKRPMKGLLEALETLGIQWKTPRRSHCPPVELFFRDPEKKTAKVFLDPSGSSQQLSGLLMVGPRLKGGLEIELTGPLPSSPYVDLTLEVMEKFGVAVETDQGNSGQRFWVPGGGYVPGSYKVEGDHSSASYLLAASALTGRPVEVINVSPSSKQGDRVFGDILEQLKNPGPKTIDMHHCPDVAPTAVAMALFRDSPTNIVNVSHLKIKECDRIQVISQELKKIGAHVEARKDGWKITPHKLQGGVTLDPHEDHRMAMVFGVVGLKVTGIEVLNPHCVIKSFPNFWETLEAFVGL